MRKKDDLTPLRTRMQREGRTGIYYVLKSMEQGPSFRIVKPKFPVDDPNWRIVAPQRSRYTHLGGQSAAEIHQALLDAHQLTPDQYTRNQLAYDLRKLRSHGLIERPDNRYVYALSDYGRNAAAMLVIVRNRILRPIAGSLFVRSPKSSLKPSSKLQAQYRRTTKSFDELINLLKAA